MAFECDICGKKPVSGNNVSHSNRKTRRTWRPNLQTVRVVQPNGSTKKILVCTRCIRSDKVTKAV
ncbi:MAG: 50S ribosomal protein L28 [bacterium]